MTQVCLPLMIVAALLSEAGSAFSDEFDALRLKWRDSLTMGTNANAADPNFAGWILSVETTAQGKWNSMSTNAGRTYLWSDLNNLGSNSGDITGTYGRIRAMAMGYAVHGSILESNAVLRGAITNALEWMYANFYSERITNEYDNFFDWEIGTPLNLNDITVLMYDKLTVTQIANYMNAVDHFTPTPDLTGANKVWKASVVAVRGAVVKNSSKIASARQSLSDVFPYVSSGDGFYADGSFVFHSMFPYNGGYGAQLIETIGPLMQLLAGSSWEVTDPMQTNLFRWIYDSFTPFIYRGAMMPMVAGRYYTRQGDDHLDGHGAIASILRIAQSAPPADAAAFKSLIKNSIQADTYLNFIDTQTPPFNIWAKAVMNDTNVAPRSELVRHYQFPRMDRVAHLRPGWGLGLAMSSSRIGNFEAIREENLHGWYTGDGMTYLYNGDLGQFADNFWPTVNPYRLPGTTVDTQTRADGSGGGYLSPNNWVGGVSIQNLYGVSGMQLNAWNSTLTARKSWFLFDDEIVCLGAGITSTDNRAIETIVENRRLAAYGDNAFTVNGAAKPDSVGWFETLTNTSWAHLVGNVPGADVGYFFPQPSTLNALREARAGSLHDLNASYGSTNRSTRNFLTLWFDHGANPSNASYAYVLLPNQTAAQVASYAANPDIVVLKNSTRAQGVKEMKLGITAVNFWSDGSNSLGGITVDRKSSVIMRNDGTFLEVGISDPTQTNAGSVNLEISAAAAAWLSADPGVTVAQLSPTIKLAVNVSGAGGQSLHARFFVGPPQTVALSPVADAFVQNGDQTNANFGMSQTLAVKAAGSSQTRETYLRFDLPPAPGMIFSATLRLVPITVNDPLYHTLAFVADNSWTETGINWNNKPAADPEFTRWLLPAAGTPVLVPVTALAHQAVAADGKLSLRISSTGTPSATNGGYTAYVSKENGAVTNRPQLILTLGRIPPPISLTSPTNGSVFDAPATVMIVADAQGPNGSVTNVSFYSGSTRLPQFNASPYSLTLSNLAAGQYSFTAVATDMNGLMSTSAPATISVYDSEPVGRGTGLWSEYYTDQNLIGLAVTRIDPTVNFSWGFTSPDPSIASDHFSVRWSGKLQARRAGIHAFHTVSDDGVRLWVNGQLLIDNWTSHTTTEDTRTMSLLPGQYYDISMDYFDNAGTAVAQLYWTQPGGTKEIIPQTQLYPADSGLRGQYYAKTNLSQLAFTRIDDVVDFSWGNSSPDPTLIPGGFSVQWKGKVRANQGGAYTFYTLSEGGVKLIVNNQIIISNWTAHAATENNGTITLAAGQFYNLTMQYFNATGDAAAVLRWAPPGEPKQVIPETNLTPHQNNNPPVLAPIPNLAITPNRRLTFAVAATDADAPAQSLGFSLDPGAPNGANINPTNGLFTWTPAPMQALGTYSVVVRVTDNGTPVMTDAQTVSIAVSSNITTARVTLVPTNTLWRYLDNGTDQGTAWRGGNFNDSIWRSGLARFGYGGAGEATIVRYGPNSTNKYITTYFRRAVFVPDASRVQSLYARLLCNDGAVVYINGAEVWRENMPAGAVSYRTLASTALIGSSDASFLSKTLSPVSLIDGTNTIAVEVHQDSADSPVMSFDFELTGVAFVPSEASLDIAMSAGAAVLRWPLDAGLFQLYAATNLSPPSTWVRVTNAPAVSNGQCVVQLPVSSNRAQFYRFQTQ